LMTDIEHQEAMARPLTSLNEYGLKTARSYQHPPIKQIKQTAPDSPNPAAPDARQSKTSSARRLTDTAGAPARRAGG
jgi:hypothetical protein